MDNTQKDVNFEVAVAPEEEIEALAAAEAYWTEERIMEATPLPLPKMAGAPEAALEARDVADSRAVVEDEVLADDEAGASEGAESLRFITSRVSNMNISPYAFVGKLYMTFGTENYVGSAWCIYRHSIFTAGHCVYDKSAGWAKNLIFKGRYSNGSQVGTWAMSKKVSLKGWMNNGDFKFDMAACVASGDIQAKMGRAGWVANIPANQGAIDAIGYPAEPIPGYNFDGRYMWHCEGRYLSGSNPIKMSNNMTGGCSGGPWKIVYDGSNRMNGLNSFRYDSDPNSMYSPYFGDGFLNIVNWLKANGGN